MDIAVIFREVLIFAVILCVSAVGVLWWQRKQKYRYDEKKIPKKMTHWEPDADPDKVHKLNEQNKNLNSGREWR